MKRMKRCIIPYGKDALTFSLPAGAGAGHCRDGRLPSAQGPGKLIADALRRIEKRGCALREKIVLLVVSDLTRHAHVPEIVAGAIEGSFVGRVRRSILLSGQGCNKAAYAGSIGGVAGLRDAVRLLAG